MRFLQWLPYLVFFGFVLTIKGMPAFYVFVSVIIASLGIIGITLFENRIERAFLARIVKAGGNPDTPIGQAIYEGLKYEYEYSRYFSLSRSFKNPAAFTLQVTAQKPGSFRVSRKKWMVRTKQPGIIFTGDSAFDHDFMLESEMPEYATAIFSTPENRDALRNIMAHGYTFIEQVGTKIKAVWMNPSTDEPTTGIVTSVIPRLALFGGVDPSLLAPALNYSDPKSESFITTSGVVAQKKNWVIACVASAFLYVTGFFYIGWRYGLLATGAIILFMTASMQLPGENYRFGAASVFVAILWTSYTVCKVRNNLIDAHSEFINQLDSFRYAAFSVSHLCMEVATASAVAAWFVYCWAIIADNFLIYFIVFGTGIAWIAELTFGMLALLIERLISGSMMNPFLEPLATSRAQSFVPSTRDIMRAIGMMVSVLVAVYSFSL